MITRIDGRERTVELELPIRGGEAEMVTLPDENIHYWYPFNQNFFYRYSQPKQMMYLSKDNGYQGENVYNIDILKKTKPMQTIRGVPFHPYVYKRNKQTMRKAKILGIATIEQNFTIEDVEAGFKVVGGLIDDLSNKIYNRVEQEYGAQEENTILAWEKIIQENTTEEEAQEYMNLGEIYTMLNIMRKISVARNE